VAMVKAEFRDASRKILAVAANAPGSAHEARRMKSVSAIAEWIDYTEVDIRRDDYSATSCASTSSR